MKPVSLQTAAACLFVAFIGSLAAAPSFAGEGPEVIGLKARGEMVRGGSYIVATTVKNPLGKRVRGRISLTLSKDRRPGPILLGRRRTPGGLPARGRKSVLAAAFVRKSTAAGKYFLVSCFRGGGGRSCGARPLSIRDPHHSPDNPGPPFVAGAQSAGDRLFPEIGNGGYNALDYDIRLNYAPLVNRFRPGTSSRMLARAKSDLWRFSLDFGSRMPGKPGLRVALVTVNGERASFTRRDDTKLIITPETPLERGETFTVKTYYSGYVNHIVDPDGALEGWMRACRSGKPGSGNPDCFGSFTVSEPIGAQSWFPNNNIPSDKAAFTTTITVPGGSGPGGWTALGTGELVSRTSGPGDRSTWRWRTSIPTSTYLTTGSVCRCTYWTATATDHQTGRTLPLYNAFDATATPSQVSQMMTSFGQQEAIINELSALFGPYPFDSGGVLAGRTTGIGYVLENQGKIHFPMPEMDIPTLVHEYAHQWFGDAVGPARWKQIWFNEGWAEWATWNHEGPSAAAAVAQSKYDSAKPRRWKIPPGTLDNDPANLFGEFETYYRPAMMLQFYRQIVGDAKFSDLARKVQADHRYGVIDAPQFIDAAVVVADLSPARSAALRDFFQQWLFRAGKPDLTAANFPSGS